jgi:hypothetical protein
MAGFVLWYAMPPMEWVTDSVGQYGAIMCLSGLVLAASSALQVGSWSFLGKPKVSTLVVVGKKIRIYSTEFGYTPSSNNRH